jgi:signal transduction histidine kinase
LRVRATVTNEQATGPATERALRRLNTLVDVQAARIASLLHDEVSQVLASAHIALDDAAEEAGVSAQLRLLTVKQHLKTVSDQLRSVSHALHPGIVEDLGLVDAVTFTARVFARRTGIQLTTHLNIHRPCAPQAGALVYRCVQEALANIARHSHATAVTIAITREGGNIACSISDNGDGFDVAATLAPDASRHLGLRLLRARIEAGGGTFDVDGAPGQGTRLYAIVPVEI